MKSREEVLKALSPYFDIEELVCNHILERWGEAAWQFLDTDYLRCLLLLRENIIQRPMYCNNHDRQTYQRGLRCNLCELVASKDRPYLSAHILGKAGDFSIEGVSGVKAMDSVRAKIKLLPEAFPCQVRIEGGVSWIHFDVRPTQGDARKVIEFFER